MSGIRKPLLVSYGGGHAKIIAAVAQGLRDRGTLCDVIGLTSAFASHQTEGVPAKSVEALIDPVLDAEWIEIASQLTAGMNHPSITKEQTAAYFAVGLRDLSALHGKEAAIEITRREGRFSFMPVGTFERYFEMTKPSIVVTTTSPRFEVAALRAAKQQGIPNLAIGDLFLIQERDWILSGDYGDNVAVLNDAVAKGLAADGFDPAGLHVTGNPAFDELVAGPDDQDRRQHLREELGVADQKVILFPAAGAPISMTGEPFMTPDTFARACEELCSVDPSYSYLMRPHPNYPFEMPALAKHGQLADGSSLSIKDAILVSDIVVVEVSTVGLQAALCGKPVICVGFADYAQFQNYMPAISVETIDEAVARLIEGDLEPDNKIELLPGGQATESVIELIEDLVDQTM